ncbi:rhamnan synthesis F family protein, partial [Enterococcus cecorum]
ITGYNRYNYIPKHLQSYFLAIRRNMFLDPQFLKYWENLTQTDSREEAIGKHETVFTKYFSDLGYRYDAYVRENSDSAMYIHPLKMLKLGVPLIKYSALANYDDNQFVWQGLQRKSEIPELLEYVKMNSKYPVRLIHNIIEEIKNKPHEEYILIIDGVQNIIPQCTRYRVLNKQEYLENHGYKVKVVNLSDFQMKDIRYASTIIVYRAPYSAILDEMVQLAHQKGTNVYFDIDDLVIDTKYTDQLSYVRGLSKDEKANYDSGVINYGKMLQLCDGAITSTARLVKELSSYTPQVMLERNIASKKLIEISKKASNKFTDSTKVKIGYFSGSISHNENFNLIKYDILKILKECSNVELHLVGYLDIPEEFEVVKNQLVFHKYVDWQELPTLISEVDINLAPLTTNIFNEAKSEIKWLEAALVKTPTVASDIGAFSDIVKNDITGFLCKDNEWFEKLKMCIENRSLCNKVAENAYFDVINHHSFNTYYGDLLTELEKEENNG